MQRQPDEEPWLSRNLLAAGNLFHANVDEAAGQHAKHEYQRCRSAEVQLPDTENHNVTDS